MTAPHGNNPDGSTRLDGTDSTTAGKHGHAPSDARASGTSTGADVTSRMTGHDSDRRYDNDRTDSYRDGDVRTDGDRRHVDELRHDGVEQRVVPAKLKPAKTSAAAVFGLVFGLAALFCALTAILAPAAVLLGLVGIVLSVVGMKMAKRVGITGKGVALGGLVTAVLGLLLGGAVLAGAAAVVNDEQRLDQLQTWIDDLREDAPSTTDLREELPNG